MTRYKQTRSFHLGVPKLEERIIFNCFFQASINVRVTIRAELLIGKEEDINGIATDFNNAKC